MATKVIMPQMGESIAEGTVVKWYKKVGDTVERDEPLFEISTDKVDTEIPSPAAGVLTDIKVGEGETVAIHTVVAIIGGEGEDTVTEAPEIESESEAVEAQERSEAPVETPPPRAAREEHARPEGEAESKSVRSSPLVRRIAAEHDVDLSLVQGSGRGGRVTKDDIVEFIESREKGGAPPTPAPPEPTPAAPPGVAVSATAGYTGRVDAEAMSVMRKSIAERMIASRRTSAHVTTVFEVDMTRIVRLREQYKERFAGEEGTKLTFTPFFIRAVVAGLQAFPVLNASVDGDRILYKKDRNIGVAVALDWGLIVPVVHHADEKSFLGLTRAVNDLAERARTKKLKPEEVQGGTFTITNPGPFGALFGTPIIHQPQVAILGIGGIHKRPVVVNDAIAVRSMVYLALSFDHRIIDGAVADQFMAEVKKHLEHWEERIL